MDSTLEFESLVSRYRKPVVSLVFRITGDRDDASDIAQEVFIRALARIEYGGSEARLASWLMVVARNAALDALRRKDVRRKYLQAPQTTVDFGPEDAVLDADRASRLRLAVARLPTRYRRAVELYYYNGLSYREIGEELHVPLGTVKTFLARGLKKMRRVPDVADLRLSA